MLPELKERLEVAAKAAGRSMNAEIVARLSNSFQSDPIDTLARGNTVLLRTLADFVVLRHKHPEVMAHMEKTMVKMALAVKGEDDDTKLTGAADPWMEEYVLGLVDSVNKATEVLGPGWAKDVSSAKPSPKNTAK
jgi:hypothetical protein